ncbi:CRISPR-associated protein Cas5 [Lachnobacterium bovis]|uniref:CRISPR-associated protein Cas5 n=1 Tax=Lachnobacterium bovis TaxID=140626 RepID=UPI00048B690A|nr:CRISPR-associated protein Cas5 [Lachnobacterium bovis]
MKTLRIILYQSQANYRREETIDNKMTYPLPPMSTVIGAVHAACGYEKYHPMDISVQGCYGSKQKRIYRYNEYLNSTMDDRGILVKMKNSSMLSQAHEIVSEALKQGASHEKEVKTVVHNRELLEEYKKLRKNRKDIDDEIKSHKNADKETLNNLKNKKKNCQAKLDNFATLNRSIKSYEVLYDVKLIIHIRADDAVVEDILKNVYNIKSIGRSEDFVDIQEAKIVELFDEIDCDEIANNSNEKNLTGYVSSKAVSEDVIIPNERSEGIRVGGTKFYLNKNYNIKNGKRIFEKKWVVYSSNYKIDDESELGDDTNVYYDGTYIVSFL